MSTLDDLKKHVATLKEKQAAAMLAVQDFNAHKEAFDSWLKAELQLDPARSEYIVPELIMLWSEKHGHAPAN